jgi:hypothetical protein
MCPPEKPRLSHLEIIFTITNPNLIMAADAEYCGDKDLE